MRKGAVGLLLLILLPIIILIIIFAKTKLLIPNPETIETKKQTEKQAQDAVDQIQQKSIQNQTIEVEP